MYILFDWLGSCGVRRVLYIIKSLIYIIRIVVPIGLVVLTGMDIMKKVINPDDKEGGKKIMHRAIAAIVVFFTPLLINILLYIVDIGLGNTSGDGESKVEKASISKFWESASRSPGNCSEDKVN